MPTLEKVVADAIESSFEATLQKKIDDVIFEHLKEWDGKMSMCEMARRLNKVLEHEHNYSIEALKMFEKEK